MQVRANIPDRCHVRATCAHSTRCCLLLQVLPMACGHAVSFGALVVHWHRIQSSLGGSDDDRQRFGTVVTRIPLATVGVSVAALTMSLDTPAQAVVGKPMAVRWQLRNNTAVLQTVEISAQPSSE